jgi:hypothetical protein
MVAGWARGTAGDRLATGCRPVMATVRQSADRCFESGARLDGCIVMATTVSGVGNGWQRCDHGTAGARSRNRGRLARTAGAGHGSVAGRRCAHPANGEPLTSTPIVRRGLRPHEWRLGLTQCFASSHIRRWAHRCRSSITGPQRQAKMALVSWSLPQSPVANSATASAMRRTSVRNRRTISICMGSCARAGWVSESADAFAET